MAEPRAYYNEHDKFAAAWLRNLISAGHIAPGDVDERDIRDVRPSDLVGYRQCHFFAGIGVWSHALRRAGWPDRRPVWTASCPCQPFSQAGEGGGFDDERHLWPAFFHLAEQCEPRNLFGEQVASKDGLAWLDLVQSDLEGTDYAFGALDICAAGFGAPHIRQRLYWTAYAKSERWRQVSQDDRGCDGGSGAERWTAGLASSSSIVELADDANAGQQWWWSSEEGDGCGTSRLEPERLRTASGLADDDDDDRLQGRAVETLFGAGRRQEGNEAGRGGAPLAFELAEPGGVGVRRGREHREHLGASSEVRNEAREQRFRSDYSADGAALHNAPTGPVNGVWRNADWLLCRDGKWRPVRSGSFPLAHGAAARMGFVCTTCAQASAQDENNEDVRALREVLSAHDGCVAPEVLQSRVHGGSVHEDATDKGSGPLSGAAFVSSDGMRALREDGAISAPAPQRQESDEQRTDEHHDSLRGLPLEGTSADACACCGRDADWLIAARISGNRVGRLRAYGNAIVATQAEEFIGAYLDAEYLRLSTTDGVFA